MKFRLSLRIPPKLQSTTVAKILEEKLTAPGPETFGAKIEFELVDAGDGFDAPDLPEKFKKALEDSTKLIFNNEKPIYAGCGGSIPFMEVFSDCFPGTNFLLTGVGFQDSNAHSANENLRLDYCRKLTTVVAVFLQNL